MTRLTVTVLALLASIGIARGADLPGSKDPPGFKRYEGSEIIFYQTRSYDEYALARDVANCCGGGWRKVEKVEGSIIRAVYRVPRGHTALELLRNYEQMLSAAGYAKNFELAPCDNTAMGDTNGSSAAWWHNSNIEQPIYGSDPSCYFTAKATKNGQDINVAVMIAESQGRQWRVPDVKDPVVIQRGEILVGVDVISSKAVENKMVVLKAADIAEALATNGKVDLYGIYFDTDKAVVKPESKPTLDEVANLLKIDRSLKLEVAGHTDNTGDKAHNQKLSEDRATAVVNTLVSQYGIDATRLQAKGYGDARPVASNTTDDGRAKNRRVELKKI